MAKPAAATAQTSSITTPSETALRNAIANGGVVHLSFDGTITLTSTLEITNDVALDAQNHAITISGNNAVRILHINPGVSFSATNLTLANGCHIGANGDTG